MGVEWIALPRRVVTAGVLRLECTTETVDHPICNCCTRKKPAASDRSAGFHFSLGLYCLTFVNTNKGLTHEAATQVQTRSFSP